MSRNHSKDKLRQLLERIDARLEEYLGAMDAADKGEQSPEVNPKSGSAQELQKKIDALRERQCRHLEALEEFKRSGEGEVSLTDPDSRSMWKGGIGYNAQIAVDGKHKLIAAQEVVNDQTDHGQPAPMAKAAMEEPGVERIKAVADGGYYDNNHIAQCEAIGAETYLPRPHKGTAASEGRFGKTQFDYDGAAGAYRCPAGATLGKESQTLKRGEVHFIYSNAKACRKCPLKTQCTTGGYRHLMRWEGEAALDRMHARVAAAPAMIELRKELVEHPFGSIKFWMGHNTFLMRGFENVRAEFSLTTLAYNIKRVMNILGAGKLLEILRKRTQTGKTSSASLFPMHYPPTLAHSRLGSSIARLFTSNTTFPLQSSISK